MAVKYRGTPPCSFRWKKINSISAIDLPPSEQLIMSTLRVSLLHLFLFLFPLPLPLCRSLHSPQPHDDPLLLLARTNNHPHLVPRTRFRSCNHNQRLSIQDAIIELRDLLRSAVGPSAPGLTPSPRAAFDDALTPGQRRFAFWFRLDNADQRRYVWQRFRALMAATEMVVEWPQGGGGGGRGGVGEGGGGGMFTFVCVDREGRCIRNPRMAGYISRADAGEFVIVR